MLAYTHNHMYINIYVYMYIQKLSKCEDISILNNYQINTFLILLLIYYFYLFSDLNKIFNVKNIFANIYINYNKIIINVIK